MPMTLYKKRCIYPFYVNGVTDSQNLEQFLKWFWYQNQAFFNQTYLHYSSKSKEGPFKILGSIYTKDVVHYSKKLLHGLCVLDVDLFDQSIQAHTSSATYLGGICQQTEMAGGFHQLQYIIAPARQFNSLLFTLYKLKKYPKEIPHMLNEACY